MGLVCRWAKSLDGTVYSGWGKRCSSLLSEKIDTDDYFYYYYNNNVLVRQTALATMDYLCIYQ